MLNGIKNDSRHIDNLDYIAFLIIIRNSPVLDIKCLLPRFLPYVGKYLSAKADGIAQCIFHPETRR